MIEKVETLMPTRPSIEYEGDQSYLSVQPRSSAVRKCDKASSDGPFR